MISVFSIARSSCRGLILQALCSKNQVFGKVPNSVFQTTSKSPTLKCTAHLSTSQKSLSSQADHSHSQIWTAERFLSAGLLGIMPLALVMPHPVLDYALALTLTVHVHWGVEAIVVDYVRPNVVGAALSRIAVAGVYALSVFTLGGLFYFNYTDIGLAQAIRMLWKL